MSRLYEAIIRRMIRDAGRVWDWDNGIPAMKAGNAEDIQRLSIYMREMYERIRMQEREKVAQELEASCPYLKDGGSCDPSDCAHKVHEYAAMARGTRD